MSIASEITRLQNAKSALATSIGNKGVTVPASTKLDGYSALVDQIQTGGGGGSDDEWVRPSNWPDYTKIPMSSIGADELYLTCDCRPAIAGYEPKGVNFNVIASDGYTVERGYIGENGFVSVASVSFNSNTEAKQVLPTEEGDFVVYRVTSTSTITYCKFINWGKYSGNQTLSFANHPVIELYGKLDNISSFPCTNMIFLESVIMSLDSMTSMNSMFSGCMSLENVAIVVTNKMTTLRQAFKSCLSLRFIDVSSWDTSNVTQFQNLFDSCYSLRRINGINSLNTKKVTNMNLVFASCFMLGDVDISNWSYDALSSNQKMFASTRFISRIEFDESLSVMSEQMFDGSPSLCTTFIFHSVTPPTMANVNAFGRINSDAKIYVPDNSVNDYKTASNWSTYASYIYPLSDYTE